MKSSARAPAHAGANASARIDAPPRKAFGRRRAVRYTRGVNEAPFDLLAPSAPPSAVVVEVPHAGLRVPPSWAGPIAAGDRDVLRDADTFVDELVTHAPRQGASVLRANVSRYVVDLNRGRDEYDARAVLARFGGSEAKAGLAVVETMTGQFQGAIAARQGA